MDKLFEIIFLDEAFEFLKGLNKKHYEKILYNIRKSLTEHDPELFKKLNNEIWEFRTLYQGHQYRLLAFWDKTSTTETFVISTHGFIKKRSKVHDNEIQKAIGQRTKYFEEKQLKNKKK
ncbi:MAG: type II toxin-antitoxin system RelE/ParE family toxin [Bacteroidetes bacterium]|nr:type II toxin-antitoxin system RelE/ParE family toxin [Bacteroidota bacterium]NCQ11487.1 type II toxin-antitoxin system RelE/ParE family toxin [Bacteroidota bacterium]